MSLMSETDSAWGQLRKALTAHDCDSPLVLQALVRVWADFDGAKLTAHKLQRLESPSWRVPVLTFEVERHGAVVLGSKVAEVQRWAVNTEAETIELVGSGKRRIAKFDERFDEKPLAERVCAALQFGNQRSTDYRAGWLQWIDDDTVEITLSGAIPATNKQTWASRRKRFYETVTPMAEAIGWQRKSNRFIRKNPSP